MLERSNARARIASHVDASDLQAQRPADSPKPEAAESPAASDRTSETSGGVDRGWPKLGDAPDPRTDRIVRQIRLVYQVERLMRPGSTFEVLA